MYQKTIEGNNLQNHSRQQAASVKANGCSLGCYMWLYTGHDPKRQVNEAIDLAAECLVDKWPLWIDVEPYTDGSLPTVQEIRTALAACGERGIQGGLYSGAWVWPKLGTPPPAFPGVPAWWADYDGAPILDSVVPSGMVLLGKQYSDKAPDGSSLDMDVFSL